MMTQHSRWTVAACAVLVMGSLLACKKKKETTTSPTITGESSGGAGATATATATAAPAPAKIYKVGESVETSEFKVTVDNVKECKPGPWTKPTKGNIWLGVETSIEATSDKQHWPSASNGKVVDSKGNVMKQTFYTGSKACEPALSGQALSKGEKTHGWVVFEVPSDASGLTFTYSTLSFMGPAPSAKFDLGR